MLHSVNFDSYKFLGLFCEKAFYGGFILSQMGIHRKEFCISTMIRLTGVYKKVSFGESRKKNGEYKNTLCFISVNVNRDMPNMYCS